MRFKDMSGGEQEVALYLLSLNLDWEYQKQVVIYDELDRKRLWYPDFYAPEIDLYIEVCGKESDDYRRRQKLYEKNEIPIVFLHTYKPENAWKFYLQKHIINRHLAMKEKNIKEKNMVNDTPEEKKVYAPIKDPSPPPKVLPKYTREKVDIPYHIQGIRERFEYKRKRR